MTKRTEAEKGQYHTTKREELAKIAGVSPTTMQMVTYVYFNVNRTMLLSPHLASVRVKK